MSYNRNALKSLIAPLVAALNMVPCLAAATDDDEIVTVVAAANPDVQEINVNFDSWVFPGAQTAEAGRHRLTMQASLQLAEVKGICNLSQEQQDKLRLAVDGDLGRFFTEVETLRRKFTITKRDREAVNEMWQEVQPLQAKQARGLTGPDSLFGRTLKAMLTAEQANEYDTATGERRRFRYKAAIAAALHSLENTVALKDEQRAALTKLLLELPPPRVFGQYDQHLVNYRLASLPMAELKPLFDDRQWQNLQQPLNQGRAMQGQLVQQGYLDGDEANIKRAEVRP